MHLFKLSCCLGVLLLAGCAMAPTVDTSHPSVSSTEKLVFIGKTFTRKYQTTRHPVRLYEFYPAGQTPDDWYELFDVEIYPQTSPALKPVVYARRLVQLFHRRFPRQPYTVYTNRKDDSLVLALVYPISVRKDKEKKYVEFSAFKFYRVSGGGRVMSLHYARNIEAASSTRTRNSVRLEVKDTRDQIIKALSVYPPFRP